MICVPFKFSCYYRVRRKLEIIKNRFYDVANCDLAALKFMSFDGLNCSYTLNGFSVHTRPNLYYFFFGFRTSRENSKDNAKL